MATNTKVQAYLERHKIGPLFEKLMASVIKEMPYDPMEFLIELLQKQNEKQFSSSAKEGLARTWSAKSGSNLGLTGRAVPTSAKVRKSVDGKPMSSRDYPKPWQTTSVTSSKASRQSDEERSSPKHVTSGVINPRQGQSPRQSRPGSASPRPDSAARVSPRKSTSEWKSSKSIDQVKSNRKTKNMTSPRRKNYEHDIMAETDFGQFRDIESETSLKRTKSTLSPELGDNPLHAARRKKPGHVNRKAELKSLLFDSSSTGSTTRASRPRDPAPSCETIGSLIDESEIESEEKPRLKKEDVSIRICATCARLISGDLSATALRAFSEVGTNDTFTAQGHGFFDNASQISKSEVSGSPSTVDSESRGRAESGFPEDDTVETLFVAETHQTHTAAMTDVQSIADESEVSYMQERNRRPKKTSAGKEAWGFTNDDEDTD